MRAICLELIERYVLHVSFKSYEEPSIGSKQRGKLIFVYYLKASKEDGDTPKIQICS